MLVKEVCVCRHVFLDCISGLHICLEFSQHPLMFISGYAKAEKVSYVENKTVKKDFFLLVTIIICC